MGLLHKLQSYEQKNEQSGISLSGELFFQAQTNQLHIIFDYSDPQNQIDCTFTEGEKRILSRKNELWKLTCFEAFWSIPGEKKYWEFNFSPTGYWNVYQFEDYRTPFPPQESSVYKLTSVRIQSTKHKTITLDQSFRLELVLDSQDKLQELEYALCVILKQKDVLSSYYASFYNDEKYGDVYKNNKPDFHVRSAMNIMARKI